MIRFLFLANIIYFGFIQLSWSNTIFLKDVLQSVDTHYPLVKVALQDLAKAQADHLAAQGGFDPLLKSSYQVAPAGEYQNRYFDVAIEQPTTIWGTKFLAGYRSGQGSFAVYDGYRKTSNDGELRGGFAIPVLRDGIIDERRAKLQTTEIGVEQAQANLNLQRLDIHRQASQRFYDWMTAGEKLKIAYALLALAQERDNILQQRVRGGDAAKIEQQDNQRSVLQRLAVKVAAERAFAKASLELSLFYRDNQGNPLLATSEQVPNRVNQEIFFKDKLNKITRIEQASAQNKTHPEIMRLKTALAQNEVEQRFTQNLWLPKLDLEIFAAKDIDSNRGVSSLFEYKAALKFEFPLLLRNAQGRSASASVQGLKLESQLALAADRIKTSATDAGQAIAAARSRLELAHQELALALVVERGEKIKFSHGDSNIMAVNIREQATYDAQVREVDAMNDCLRAMADFEALKATDLSDKLK